MTVKMETQDVLKFREWAGKHGEETRNVLSYAEGQKRSVDPAIDLLGKAEKLFKVKKLD